MKKLSTVLIETVVKTFSVEDAKTILKDIIENKWDELNDYEKELLIEEVGRLKGLGVISPIS